MSSTSMELVVSRDFDGYLVNYFLTKQPVADVWSHCDEHVYGVYLEMTDKGGSVLKDGREPQGGNVSNIREDALKVIQILNDMEVEPIQFLDVIDEAMVKAGLVEAY